MSARIDFKTVDPAAYRALSGVQAYVYSSPLPKPLLYLVAVRASQINSCAFCIDMHTQEALDAGETPQRLTTLSAWRETSFFTEVEQAVLALTEAVTLISQHGVSDEIFEAVAKHFNEKEIVQLLVAISAINSWNRLAVATGTQPAQR